MKKMKRSEFIKALAKYTRNYYHPMDNHEEMAEAFLTYAEDSGMKPPSITVMKDSYNRSEGTYGFEVNEWEPEDEKTS